jgi:DNA-binding GntR family transcriptional regulator
MFSGNGRPGAADADVLTGELHLDEIERPAERAYQGIRHAILSGALPGGSHLPEEALAQMTGTSRTPVREALRRLVAEGLARADHRHRYVADFSYEELKIVFDIRARLESYAARVAAELITAAEITELEHIIDQIDGIGEAHDPALIRHFADLNTRFHTTIVQATRSIQMQSLSAQAVSLPLEMIKQFVWEQRVNIARSNDQHRDIVAALKARDPEWAETAMSGHILSTRPRRKMTVLS